MSKKLVQRRQFLKSSAVAGMGLLIMPSGFLSGANAASNKLNIALIGTWGRARAHFDTVSSENVVALCDINEDHIASAAKKFPKAKTYVDWRKCLEQKDIDAVVISTTDHTHAFIANWAINRGMHVYCEKPIANTVEEARVVRANYLKNKNKIATQVGTQRHQIENFDRVRELVKDGAIGELKHVYAWGNRQLRRPGYLPGKGTPPKNLKYDLWLGPSPYHPYNPGYFTGGPGANCLQWNMYWDFGSGQIGDMGSHTMDLAWNAIDADLPTSAVAEGDEYNPEVTPVELRATFEVPANDWRGAIGVTWCQGGAMPKAPKPYVDLNRIGHGAMFKGSKGYIIADFNSRILMPYGRGSDLGYYNKRDKKDMIKPMGHFQKQWTKACKGDLKTSCGIEYNSKMMEMMLLGLVAYRAGEKITYDSKTGRVKGNAKADGLLSKEYRKGWTLDG